MIYKKLIISFLLILSLFYSNAQSYTGYLSDNYSGLNSIALNPANIADSRFQSELNVALNGSAIFNNDAIGYDMDKEIEKKSFAKDNNAGVNLDFLGPSYMFNIDKKSAIALTTRIRGFLNGNQVDGTFVNDYFSDKSTVLSKSNLNLTAHSWGEFGVTYARVITNKKDYFLKGGITLKFLQGIGARYIKGNNLNINYDNDGTILSGGKTTGSITSSGELVYGSSSAKNSTPIEILTNTGFGMDLGVIYEWRPDYRKFNYKNIKGKSYTRRDKNMYKLKLGLSLTDIGRINYKSGLQENYNVQGTNISEDVINDIEELDDVYSLNDTKKGYKAILPTAIHLNADWNFNDKFYINLNTDLSLISKNKLRSNHISNTISLTPRFESKSFSFYLPMSLVRYSGFQVGAGLRYGFMYVGSGNIFSLYPVNGNIFNKKSNKAANVYFGIKVPILHKKPKDSDNDGLIDVLDECPNVAGPYENVGCPILPDKDGDYIIDEADECPDIAGPLENKGCPWGDKDGDSVFDIVDECPKIAGPKENNGCPIEDLDFTGDDESVSGDVEINSEKFRIIGTENQIETSTSEGGNVLTISLPNAATTEKRIQKLEDEIAKLKAGKEGELETDEVKKSLYFEDDESAKLKTNKESKLGKGEVKKSFYAKTILFRNGDFSIEEEFRSTLIELSKIIKEYPIAKFLIEAHTDNIGDSLTNQKLSESRAMSVKNFLINNNVDPNRLSTIGYGESKPVLDNDSDESRTENRRVEINLIN